jgi:hypothetical protein
MDRNVANTYGGAYEQLTQHMAMPIDRTPTARTPMAGMAHVFGGDGVADGDNEARFLLNRLQPA